MNMPMNEERSFGPNDGGQASSVVDGDGATNLAPDLDAVLPWRNPGDVDLRPAGAGHDVLHGTLTQGCFMN